MLDIEKDRKQGESRWITCIGDDIEDQEKHNLESCIHKILSSDTRTGHRVLKSNGIHAPIMETMALMKAKFLTTVSANTLLTAGSLTEKAKKVKRPAVTKHVLLKVIGNTKNCTAARCSGWRNSRLKLISTDPDGLQLLCQWTQRWADGRIPDLIAKDWRPVLGVPLKKGDDGLDIRPVLIGEALISLPGAWLKFITQTKAQKLFKNVQFGIGVPAGAEVMIALCQALIKLDPSDGLFVLDMVNAFGEISRAEVLEEAS